MKSRGSCFQVAAVALMAAAAFRAVAAQDTLPPRTPGSAEKVAGFAVIDRSAVRPGASFRLVIDLEIEPGWHIYGNPVGPGVGKPTEVAVTAPAGIRFGPVRYSRPHRLEQSDLGPGQWVWAYEDSARLYLEGRVEPGTTPGDYEVGLAVDCLACTESCVPELVELTAVIRVAAEGESIRPAFAALFEGFDEARTAGGKEPAAPAGIGGAKKPPAPGGAAGAGTALDEAARRAIAEYAAHEQEPRKGLLLWILIGFLAGMILNVMPCVLPVISIKILSLVQQSKEDRRTLLRHGLVFSAGILAVFLVLAGAAAFAGQSWGSQFQSPTFLVAMIVIIFLFSLGLFDLYTIELPGFVSRRGGQAREGYGGSFSKGMLATLLATPCSGPLLGAALTYALSRGPLIIFVMFTSIGLGMAIPYVILTAYPGFLRFVPKPGPWMVRFKEFMGFVLLGTVVYLLGIVSHELRIWVLSLCLVLGLSAWIFGRVTGPERPRGHRLFWRTAALAVAVGLGYWTYGVLVVGSDGLEPEPFSLARLRDLGRTGRTVVVDWTADWCPNCKYVEKTVLESETVRTAMRNKGVVFMRADITEKRPVEEGLMNQLGSYSIPFLGIFPGDRPKRPFTLRDIYSRADVLEILARCPDPGRGPLAVSPPPPAESKN